MTQMTIEYIKGRASCLYTIFFAAAEGHPSLVDRGFENYMNEVTSLFPLNDELQQLLKDWHDYKYNGRNLTLNDDLYWHTDHMSILLGDFEEVNKDVEEKIANWHRDDDVEYVFLDLVRRTLHGIEMMCSNYEEIRAYLDDAKKKTKEEETNDR